MSEPNNNPAGQEATPAAGGEVTFTQAEVDALVSKEKAKAVAKATKGMPTSEELAAFNAWKGSQQSEKEKLDALTKERDEASKNLAAALQKVEQYERERYLTGKGVPADDIDYYAFKIGQMVSDDKSFEQAAEEFLKAKNAKQQNNVRVDMTAPLDRGAAAKSTTNDAMNAMIRGAFK